MAADSTLVGAAFREATSRAGGDFPNLKALYDSNRAMSKQALGIVTSAMDRFKKQEEVLRIGKEKQLGNFKSIMENNYKKLFIGKETMPQEIVNAVDDVVRKLQDDFELVNTYGKNDTVENERARTRLSAQLQKVINEAINARATFIKLGDDTKTWNDGAVKGDLTAMIRMFDLDNIDKDDNVSVYFDDNQKLTFRVQNHLTDGDLQYGDVNYTIDQMRKNIPAANFEADANLLGILNSQQSQAKTRADNNETADFSRDEVKKLVSKQILTKDDFTNVALRRLDDIGEKSFKTNLMENMNIAIDTMDVTFQNLFSNLDLEKDGVINELDLKGLSEEDQQAFNASYKKMISVLTDVDDDDFNLDRSKKLFTNYFTDFAEQKYNKEYDTAVKRELTNVPGNYQLGSNGYLINASLVNDNGVFGRQEYIGWKMGKKGNILYDDVAVSNSIDKGESFVDAFQNEYRRVERGGKFVGYEIYGLKEGATTISYITFVSPEKAKLWTVGKTTVKNNSINTSNY